ncbi:Holliday junction resolvase RecU [Absiella sp. AM54-8XD]|jgi:recombination protein U|uniref:Holliday junction resolvase RecU n=2 Tax=Amedibacillus TaxID=2749846 RepID=A0A7G9GLJ9_9FIRM|nr:Holliday junction resolvase RecU [[Eubacterium] hominis]RGB56099.1 Holliday junction resolvase RecU [Absiella sp. AM22-9]RGB61860.1 Holliday junction resolvase RecU [Absiella sp. AM10-20]RGB70317.1 Holliday junction resolvase RecU [Absiella sp. AM09-45]RGB78749.1 Holliday junction resolvase RecU [Absiella sp. AM09-50]RGC25466.1 Holliday junction resolvase RecU [Absiella sp. AM54-8XD]RHU09528.1 Holliday junction resolvase RecU [Absiella sp. AM27-20]
MVIVLIGYPNRKQMEQPVQKSDNHMGRGMNLEKDLNDSNTYYEHVDRALIHKKPTPIQVVKVEYPARSAARICEAYYKTPSTTDYNGIYRGKPIDFEAKETKSKTSFPFKSIHKHQIEHLRKVLYHKGIGFFIIRFTSYGQTFLIDAGIIIRMWDEGKKSITYQEVQQCGSLIKESLTPRLRYLDNVDAIYFKEEESYGKES